MSEHEEHLCFPSVMSRYPTIKCYTSIVFVLSTFITLTFIIINIYCQGDQCWSGSTQQLARLSPGFHRVDVVKHVDSHADLQFYSSKGYAIRAKFNCKKLFDDDTLEKQKVKTYTEQHNYTFPTLELDSVPDLLSDCEAFKKARGYKTDQDVTPEEWDYPLAYVFLVHLDFEHMERLLRMLFTPQNVFCIHVDAKASESVQRAMRALVQCFPQNVMLSSDPQNIVYAHMTRLMADISCMRDLVNSKKPWRYLINMAATELPLKTNLQTVQLMKLYRGLNDIRENERGMRMDRLEYEFAVIDGKLTRTNVRLPPPPHNITLVKGLAYNTYTREFMEWAMTDQKSLDLLKWSEKTFSPDEHYWSTLNDLYHNPFLKTPGGFRDQPDKMGYMTKFINWRERHNYSCEGRMVHNICLISAQHLHFLVDRRELAANKFDLTYDPVAYACVEELLENRTRTREQLNTQPYDNYFFKFDPYKVVPVKKKVVPVKQKVVPVKQKVVPVKQKVVPVKQKVVPVKKKFFPVKKKVVPVKARDH